MGKLTNIPENQWLEDVFPIEIVPFGWKKSLVFRGDMGKNTTLGPETWDSDQVVGHVFFQG